MDVWPVAANLDVVGFEKFHVSGVGYSAPNIRESGVISFDLGSGNVGPGPGPGPGPSPEAATRAFGFLATG